MKNRDLVWDLLRPYKRYMGGTLALNVLAAVFNVFSFTVLLPILQILFRTDQNVYTFTPWNEAQAGELMDVAKNNVYYFSQQLIANYGPTTTLLLLGLVLTVLTLLKTATYFGGSAMLMPLRTGVVRDIRRRIYDKITALPLRFFSAERKGDIITRMSTDVNEIDLSITQSLDMVVKNPIFILVYVGTLFAVSWQLTLFTLCVVPLMAWGIGSIGKKLKAKSLVMMGLLSDSISQVEETLGGLRVIKAFVAEEAMRKRFNDTNDAHRRVSQRVGIRQAAAHPVSEFLGTAMIVVVLWFGGMLIFSGHGGIDAAVFIYYLVILYSLLQPIKDLSKATYAIQKGMASLERISTILTAQNDMQDGSMGIESLREGIEFRRVGFSYEEGVPVLRDVNLRIRKGQTIALVGQSGSGKSTLADLVARFHDPTVGRIYIDGMDIRELRIASLRSLIGNVSQEALLFNDTIASNIAFGMPGATRKQIEQAARTANAHDFIMSFPDGYDTVVGDRGGKLSGGQRQRISIARAILKNPPILILDEATSALDTESERLVQEALERLMHSRTTIAIAHRLSTIRHATEICVMHEGQIVERGSHEELIAKGGRYKHLYDIQQL